MTNNYRVICAIIAWITLSLTYVDIAQSGRHPGAVASAGAFLVFFTVLTNILVAVAFTAPLLNPDGKFRNFFMRPAVRTAIAIYIFNTAVVYHVVLASHYDPQGLTYWRHISLNTVMPTLYILDWLFVAKKQPLFYSQIPYWIIYPTAYGVLTVLRGSLTGEYTYPFLDVGELGGGGVLLNIVGLSVVFAFTGAIFVALAHAISKHTET